MPEINTILEEAKAFLASPIKSLAEAISHLEAFIAHHEPKQEEIPMIPAGELPKETLEEIAEHFGVETSEVESVGVSEAPEPSESLSSPDTSGEPVAASSGASDEAPHQEVNDQAVS